MSGLHSHSDAVGTHFDSLCRSSYWSLPKSQDVCAQVCPSVLKSVFVGAWSGVCGLVVHVVGVCYRIPSTILCTKKLSFEVIGATVKNSLGLFL